MKNVVDAVYHHTIGMPEWNANPFISALGPYRTDDELMAALHCNPYAGRDITQTPNHLRDVQIDRLVGEAFVVTTRDLLFASAVQRMVWTGLERRSPSLGETWTDIAYFSELARSGKSVDLIPWSAKWADGGVVSEITGMGKTHRSRRILSLWPSGIRHKQFPGLPWAEYLQVGWLFLDMSFDGNLAGLLLHILREIDVTLDDETSYAIELPKRARNIQQLQVWVIDALKRHFCGLIVYDELQAVSLLKGKDPELVANFFLRLMNQGIPSLPMGNPFAFRNFETVAQVWDRVTAVSLPSLLPGGFDDTESRDEFLPALWRMQVMPIIGTLTNDIKKAVFDCSAWHPRHVVRAIQNGQRVALAEGENMLTKSHIHAGFEHCVDPRTKRRIAGFVEKDATLLLPWTDIPVLQFAQSWGISDKGVLALAQRHDAKAAQPKKTPRERNEAAPDKEVGDAEPKLTIMDLVTREKAKVQRRVASAAKSGVTPTDDAADLSPDDLRKAGFRAALEEAHALTPSAPSSTAKRNGTKSSKPREGESI